MGLEAKRKHVRRSARKGVKRVSKDYALSSSGKEGQKLGQESSLISRKI